MKRFWGTLMLIILAAVGLAVVTCPDRQAHKDAVMQKVDTAVDETLKSSMDGNEALGLGGLIVDFVGGPILSKLAVSALDSKLHYNNYFIFSTMSIPIKGEEKTMSLGLFGHVFVGFDADDLNKLVKE